MSVSYTVKNTKRSARQYGKADQLELEHYGNTQHGDFQQEDLGVEVRYAAYPNWFTSNGVYLKQKLLKAEGFPMPEGWMMLTLTVDREWFRDELDAYLTVKKDVPRHMKWLAKKLHHWGYFEESRYCVNWWKFEFQADGWPHWHIFFNLLEKVTLEQLETITKKFKWGRVEYKQCDKRGLYAFKYAFKAPLKKFNKCELKNAVPEWFANYYEIVDGKPQSFSGVRFFQRSRNFQKNHSDWLVSLGKDAHEYRVIQPREKKERKSCTLPRPVWMVLDEKLRKVQFIARNSFGDYICSKTATLTEKFHEFEKWLIQQTLLGEVVNTKPHHYFMENFPLELVTETAKLNLKKICQKNKITKKQALKVQEASIRRNLTGSAFASRV